MDYKNIQTHKEQLNLLINWLIYLMEITFILRIRWIYVFNDITLSYVIFFVVFKIKSFHSEH